MGFAPHRRGAAVTDTERGARPAAPSPPALTPRNRWSASIYFFTTFL